MTRESFLRVNMVTPGIERCAFCVRQGHDHLWVVKGKGYSQSMSFALCDRCLDDFLMQCTAIMEVLR